MLHNDHYRKGTDIPYISHLLGVCSLVLSDGGNEDEAIAALLHDALEDQGDKIRRSDIKRLFGENVLELVDSCTHTPIEYTSGTKPPWHERKVAYLEHIKSAEPSKLRVTLADKLDNARSILVDYRLIGDDLWSRFNAGKSDQLWYYRSVLDAFKEAGMTGSMMEELERVVGEIERIAGDGEVWN